MFIRAYIDVPCFCFSPCPLRPAADFFLLGGGAGPRIAAPFRFLSQLTWSAALELVSNKFASGKAKSMKNGHWNRRSPTPFVRRLAKLTVVRSRRGLSESHLAVRDDDIQNFGTSLTILVPNIDDFHFLSRLSSLFFVAVFLLPLF